MFTRQLSRFVPASDFRYAYRPEGQVIASPEPSQYERVETLGAADGAAEAEILRRPENGSLLYHEPAERRAREVVEVGADDIIRAKLYDEVARLLAPALEASIGGAARVEAFHSPSASLVRVVLDDRCHRAGWRLREGRWVAELTDLAGVPLGDQLFTTATADDAPEDAAAQLRAATVEHHAAAAAETQESQEAGPVHAVFKLQYVGGAEPTSKTYIRGRAPAFSAVQHFLDLMKLPKVDQMNSYLLLPAEGDGGELGLASGRYPAPTRLRIGNRSKRSLTEEDRHACRRVHDAHFVPGCLCSLAYLVATEDPERPDLEVCPVKCPLHRDAHRKLREIPDDTAELVSALNRILGVRRTGPSEKYTLWTIADERDENPRHRKRVTRWQIVESSVESNYRISAKLLVKTREETPGALPGEVCSVVAETQTLLFESNSAAAVAHYLAANLLHADADQVPRMREHVRELAGRLR